MCSHIYDSYPMNIDIEHTLYDYTTDTIIPLLQTTVRVDIMKSRDYPWQYYDNTIFIIK